MRCIIDCPDRGKCYLENQAQCCPVFRVNCKQGAKAIQDRDIRNAYQARKKDKEDPIVSVPKVKKPEIDKALPRFLVEARMKRYEEVLRLVG